MAITDFATLRATVQTYCGRSDTKFSTMCEMFVAFAEDRIFNGAGAMGDPLYSPALRIADMETTATITLDAAGVGALPARTLAVRSLVIAGQAEPLHYMVPADLEAWKAQAHSGTIRRYTTVGDELRCAPAGEGTASAVCYVRPAALTVEAPSHSILLAQPMLYLSAVLFEAFTWLQDDTLAAGHLGRFRSQVAGANRVAQDKRLLSAPIVPQFEPIG